MNTEALQRALGIFQHNQRAFAEKLGYHESALSLVINGKRGLTPALAKKIEVATEEAVLREELLPEIFDRSWSQRNPIRKAS
ncbi:YdaS family helix-turn-helix protein [Acidithiobacillus ferriphilus]|uniref:HTH cro/C1-type domain-containing protein n=2 Tax=Acidithiobacillus TaxID=119977 RepID=A0A179BNR0_ACIFR|nr:MULTISPECIES: YdaS family helix-turn-helix protein [Acidithiobacillus]MEB8487354.1 YdaS family helix-turn-helix protein [Acidithiobacillus ferriphilus]MEB8489903.1 YdaS family helix-turn-helix protein [Acidithiobacillus ferriphilus]MEB8492026.1 YdaS family helix-turn-helix protein [Acidithiobacillus ferriphilus]MEB8522652.1 YdaS family helix-turn-helix protein [Acidithiobacillus ferriphilus]MEB8533736.1 YdaS family helix-turn-helix protein [Acidithiobacillus ferriphilus]